MSDQAPTGSPPNNQNSPPPGAESPPTASPPPVQGSPPPTQKQNPPPPTTTPPPSNSSSSSPPASTPPASPPPPSSSSGSGSSPPPAASPPPPRSGSSKSPPPPNESSSNSPPPQDSPTSAVPPPPQSHSSVSPPPPPPASPNHSTPPLSSPPNSPAISSPPPKSSGAESPPTPVATDVPPPPVAGNSGSPPPPPKTISPPSAESPPNVVPSPQTAGSPPASSIQNSTSTNVPPSTSTTPSSQTPNNVPKLSPPPPSNHSQSSSSSKSSDSSADGPVIGITVAGVVIVAFFAFLFVARRRKKREEAFVGQFKSTPKKFSGQSEGYYYHSQQYTGGASGQSETYYGGKPMGSPAHGNGYANHIGYSPQAPEGSVMGTKSWFSYEELTEITTGFSRQNILGEGGFGCVYKGWMPDGRIVAVKQLKAGSGQGEREFQAEVEIISRVHHRHLVSLVGYCIAEHHRLLVYEFVSNNTLEHHLHGKGLPVMEWSKRVKIALGAARGLAYLHEDCHPKIIHRDIKSANILIDDVFEAQVADFGLAKLTNDTNTHVSTRVMGTFGYMAPEYASSGKLTDRSDVFSFGVVLLELVTGRKPIDPTQPYGDGSLVEWARPLLIRAIESGDFEEIADPRLEKRYVESEMFRMIETAAACVRHSAQKRPRMSQVVRALDTEGEMGDISNGVKFGQSTVFETGQYPADIQKFRRMAFGNSDDSSEYSTYSGENNSREVPRKSPGPWSENDSSDFSSGSKFIP